MTAALHFAERLGFRIRVSL